MKASELNMKKVLKVIGIVLLLFISLIVLLIVKAAITPMVPKDYTQTVSAGGAIEEKYLKIGPYQVSHYEEAANDILKKYQVFYPSELTGSGKTYPAVVFVNGTGVPASKYTALFEHLASWGFIVIGSEDKESWSGTSSDQCLDFLIQQVENQDSIFYQKIDFDNIGISGHSQGGVGVFNAITELEHSTMYKTAVALSPTHEEQAISVNWHYDLTQIKVPLLLLAGTQGDFETQLVIPFEKMTAMYDKIPSSKVMARKTGCEHGEMLYYADGYVTAWLMWQLQGDAEAGAAFIGTHPEILDNALYQDVKISLDS